MDLLLARFKLSRAISYIGFRDSLCSYYLASDGVSLVGTRAVFPNTSILVGCIRYSHAHLNYTKSMQVLNVDPNLLYLGLSILNILITARDESVRWSHWLAAYAMVLYRMILNFLAIA